MYFNGLPLQTVVLVLLTSCFLWSLSHDTLTSHLLCPANLHQMHKLNEEAYTRPEQRARKAPTPTLAATAPQPDQPAASVQVSGTVATHSLHL